MRDIKPLIAFIRELYGEGVIPLHAPRFRGKEKQYLQEAVDFGGVHGLDRIVEHEEAEWATW